MRLTDVQTLLRKRCASAGSMRAFARERGVGVQYISQVLSGSRPPSERLCKALGIKTDGTRWVKQ